jgi:monofunctional chorismate mutase
MDIDELRVRIDVIDEEIVRLLEKRAGVVGEVKEYKSKNGMGVLDTGREHEVFEDVRRLARERGLNEDFVERVFREIVEESKKLQLLED